MKSPLMLNKQRLYPTYQVVLEVHPKGSLDADTCWRKTILYVTGWIKQKCGDCIPGVLAEYPAVNEAEAFNIKQGEDVILREPVGLRMFSWADNWTIRMEEIYPDFPGSFVTHISIEKRADTVLVAVLTECRQNEGSAVGKTYRPSFVTNMVDDEEFLLTEFGIPEKYPISYSPLYISGKSGEALKDFFESFLSNPCKGIDVIFYPEPRNSDDEEQLNQIAHDLMGYYYVVVITKSTRKFFVNIMPFPPYWENLEDGKAIIHRQCFREEGEPSMMLIGGIYPADKDLRGVLNEKKHTDLLSNIYDFSAVSFIEDLKNEYVDFCIKKAGDEGNDHELIDSLLRSSDQLREQLQSEKENLEACRNQIAHLENGTRQRKDEIGAYLKEISELKKRADQQEKTFEKQKKISDERISILEDRLNAQSEAVELMGKYIGCIVDSLSMFEGRDDSERYINWVKRYYSDLIILHPDAEQSIRADSEKHRDWRVICYATHYISGFCKFFTQGTSIDTANEKARVLYDPENHVFEVTRAISGVTRERYAEDYKLNIQIYHENEDDKYKTVYMEYHIQYYQKGNTPLFRIYFYYDNELGKAIIGHLPGHLRIFGYDG